MKFVDCFMVMGTALSIKAGREMQRPILQEAFPTSVNISLDIREIRVINPKTMEVQITALLNQKWIDPRLGANVVTQKLAVAGQIWRPKIVPVEGVNTICGDENFMFWRGYGEEGHVVLNEKIVLKTFCTTEFRSFPFDTQICEIMFGSYRFPMDEVELRWDTNPVQVFSKVAISEFQLKNVSSYDIVDVRQTGNFSSLMVQLQLERFPAHYILCTVIPCSILIALNYFTLWLSLHKRLLRYQLNIGCLLFLLYFYYTSVCTPFIVQFFKALDIFVVICVSFCSLTVVENYVVDYLCELEEEEFHLKKVACRWEYPDTVVWIEYFVRISYPVFFGFVVTFYFCFYLAF